MSEQKKSYIVSQEERTAIHGLLDKVMQAEDIQGVVVLCCAFTQDGTEAVSCATGTMSMDDAIQGIAKCSGNLLRRMEEQIEQRCAETPASEMRQ